MAFRYPFKSCIFSNQNVITAHNLITLPLVRGIHLKRYGNSYFSYSRFSTASPSHRNEETGQKTLVDGVNLYWEKFGNGPHVALCVPGLVGSIADNYTPVAKKMNLEKFTLIAVDLPGYGKSRPPDRVYSSKDYNASSDAQIAANLMKELGYNKYSVIGWSSGGMSGAVLAAMCPENVTKLVMCNSLLRVNARFGKMLGVMAHLDSWPPAQLQGILQTYERPYLLKMLNDAKSVVDNASPGEQALFTNWYCTELSKIRAPTLYIRSMDDIIVPLEDSKDYGNFIPNFKLHKVAKGGHNHLEFLDEFVAATESFLSEEDTVCK